MNILKAIGMIFLFFFVIHMKETEGETILLALLIGLFFSITSWGDKTTIKIASIIYLLLGILISIFSIMEPVVPDATIIEIVLLRTPNQGWWDLWLAYTFLFASMFLLFSLLIMKVFDRSLRSK